MNLSGRKKAQQYRLWS